MLTAITDNKNDTSKVRLGKDLEQLAMWAARWAKALHKDAPEISLALVDRLVDKTVQLRTLIPDPEMLKRLADYADSAFEYDFGDSCLGYPNDKYANDGQDARDLAQRIESYFNVEAI